MFWTGDNTAHDNPWYTEEEVTESLEAIISTVQNAFSNKMDRTFVSLGNHDAYPWNNWNFADNYPDSDVLELLHNWVPKEQHANYDDHGYYSKDIPELKARVISINSESCDIRNMYQWTALSDPNGLFGFLESQLAEAEQMGYKALFLGHIPDECSH